MSEIDQIGAERKDSRSDIRKLDNILIGCKKGGERYE